MKYRNLYVAASRQHVGKTTSTLGLVSAFLNEGINIGYCKPIGQKFIRDMYVDKDTLLFADLIQFNIRPEVHSPVVLPGKKVREMILEPTKNDFTERIIKARSELESLHDLTIYEGTGHPGVGSVVGHSNAKVAKLLDAGVIMIVEGGIGSTIDMLHMCTALFREEKVPIVGVIINKVRVDKLDKVSKYLNIWLKQQGIPLLGILPYDETLAYPLMSAVADAIKATVMLHDDMLDNRVQGMIAGSLVDLKELKSFQDILLIASYRTINRAIKRVRTFSDLKGIDGCPLSGVIVTGEAEIDDESLDYIKKHKIPLLLSNFDTYGAVLKISRIEVKINRHTPWKVKRAIELIESNVDLKQILASNQI